MWVSFRKLLGGASDILYPRRWRGKLGNQWKHKANKEAGDDLGGRRQKRRRTVYLRKTTRSFHPELFCSGIRGTGQHLEGIFIRPNIHPNMLSDIGGDLWEFIQPTVLHLFGKTGNRMNLCGKPVCGAAPQERNERRLNWKQERKYVLWNAFKCS